MTTLIIRDEEISDAQAIYDLTANFFSVSQIFSIVLILLLGGAVFFTVYFGFVNVKHFPTAINVVRGKYDALESHFDAQTMEIHYSKHHSGYVSKLNAAIEGTDLEGNSIEDILTNLDLNNGAVRDNGGGSLQTVVDIAGLFIEKGPVVQVRTKDDSPEVLSDRDMIKQFRNVIVQQTYEPRLNFYTNDAYKKQLYSVVKHVQYDGPEINKTLNASNGIHDKKVFSIIGRELYDAHADNFIKEKINLIDVSTKISEEVDPRNPELEFYAEWSKAALDYIKLVSENNGCNFYTFKWFGSYNTQPKTYPKKGLFTGEEDMFTLIREAGLASELSKPGSHPTEKILEFALEKLVSELEEIGYK